MGSFLFYFFNLVLLINWFSNIEINSIFINFVPDQIAYFIPRLGGYSMDSNRGNVVLFFSLMLRKKRKNIATPSYNQVTKPIYSHASGRWKRCAM